MRRKECLRIKPLRHETKAGCFALSLSALAWSRTAPHHQLATGTVAALLNNIMKEPSTPLTLKSSTLVDCGPHRISSRSVSWNASGHQVAAAASDYSVRIFGVDAGGAAAREVLVVNGHTAVVTKARFHPSDEHVLATAANDKTIRLWDVRNATQRSTGRIDVQSGSSPFSVEWSPQQSLLVVAERDGSIYVYDSRHLSSSDRGSGRSSQALHTFRLPKHQITEACIFSADSSHLVAEVCTDYVGSLKVWPLLSETTFPDSATSFPTHGPIYTMQISPNKRFLATGASDACVSVWDTASMACQYTVSRPTKYISSISFSHDSQLLATYANADTIDIADASNGALVGMVTAAGRRLGVLDEICWHPKEHVLACARQETNVPGMPPAPVVIVKVDMERVASQ